MIPEKKQKKGKLDNQKIILELSANFPDVNLDFIITALMTTDGNEELGLLFFVCLQSGLKNFDKKKSCQKIFMT